MGLVEVDASTGDELKLDAVEHNRGGVGELADKSDVPELAGKEVRYRVPLQPRTAILLELFGDGLAILVDDYNVKNRIVVIRRPAVDAFLWLLDVGLAEAGLEAVEGLADSGVGAR